VYKDSRIISPSGEMPRSGRGVVIIGRDSFNSPLLRRRPEGERGGLSKMKSQFAVEIPI
jgi:hypothetical protein